MTSPQKRRSPPTATNSGRQQTSKHEHLTAIRNCRWSGGWSVVFRGHVGVFVGDAAKKRTRRPTFSTAWDERPGQEMTHKALTSRYLQKKEAPSTFGLILRDALAGGLNGR